MSSVVVVTADPAIVVTQDNPAVTAVVPVTAQPYAYSSLSGLPTLGTAAALNVGTGANQVVELDASARLPPVDGSLLTNLPLLARALHCGRLVYVSATQIALQPFKGPWLQINGLLFQIPAAGVTISNAGLAASTLYYVYAYMNASVMTLELSATGHTTSATAANLGTEIKTGDDTRALVGMVYTSASSQFVDSATNRQVRSWFNESGIIAAGVSASATSTSSTGTYVETDTASRATALLWANELVLISATTNATNNTAGQAVYNGLTLNGILQVTTVAHIPSINYDSVLTSTSMFTAASDALNVANGYELVTGGTGTYINKSTAMISMRR